MKSKHAVAAAAVLSVLAVSGVALAQTAPFTLYSFTPLSEAAASKPEILQAGASGHAIMRGTVVSVSNSSFTLRSWGGIWNISVTSSTGLLPAGLTFSDIKAGDYVGIEGTVSTSSALSVQASLMHDWDVAAAFASEARDNYQAVRSQMLVGTPRVVQGTIQDLSGRNFTLSFGGGGSLVANAPNGAKILSANWLTLDFSKIHSGDLVRLWGPVSSSSVSASILRDLSR